MKFLPLQVLPLHLVPAFAIIGAANNQREWLGAIVGGCIGLFLALAAMGRVQARFVDTTLEQKHPLTREHKEESVHVKRY